MTITKFEMPENLEATGYCLFPQALEDDPLVLFHATPMTNFAAIDADGFKIPILAAALLEGCRRCRSPSAAIHRSATR